MQLEDRYWQSPEALKDISVCSSASEPVPLSAFTHYETTTTALAVNHLGQFPAVTLSFNLAPGVALGDAIQAIDAAEQEIGIPAGIQASFQGTAQAFQSSLANEPVLILAALVAVYIVLGILYESYVHPITILSTLPSAGIGAILALMICRTDLSVVALIGIILLIGIVKKNAIMMIDVALDVERERGPATTGGDLPRMPAAVPADPHDHARRDAGRPSARVGNRDRLGTPAASGIHDRGWADRESDAYFVYHSGGLPLSGPVAAVVGSLARQRYTVVPLRLDCLCKGSAAGMLAIAGEFQEFARIFTIGAAVFFAFRDGAGTRRMRTNSFFLLSHKSLLRKNVQSGRQIPLYFLPGGSICIL